jgi:hypothetical protein
MQIPGPWALPFGDRPTYFIDGGKRALYYHRRQLQRITEDDVTSRRRGQFKMPRIGAPEYAGGIELAAPYCQQKARGEGPCGRQIAPEHFCSFGEVRI